MARDINATLAKEVWVNQLMENFYPDSSFLKYARDFTGLVENNAINMAEVGADPKVLINNTTYPIKVVQRIDNPLRIELDTFETENTLVRRPIAIEYSYDQLESVLMGHRNTLRARTAQKAAHAYAPEEDTLYTPVISTTGDAVNGRKRLTVADILALKERFDNSGLPLEGRFLVLNPSHLTDLILFDVKAFKDITDIANGMPRRFAGFSILQTTATPEYDLSTMKKIPFDNNTLNGDTDTEETENADATGEEPTEVQAEETPVEKTFCSFAFHESEVMKADGEVFMYSRDNDPEERGTIVGFDKRFIALPIRNKGVGAIVSSKATV